MVSQVPQVKSNTHMLILACYYYNRPILADNWSIQVIKSANNCTDFDQTSTSKENQQDTNRPSGYWVLDFVGRFLSFSFCCFKSTNTQAMIWVRG